MVPPEVDPSDPEGEGDAGAGEEGPRAACEETAPSAPEDLRVLEPDPVDPATPAGELEKLRQELTDLRTELQTLRRTQAEGAEFAELFPDVSLSDLPDTVWEDVGRGIPVSAAYALFERREAHNRQVAKQVNEQNRVRSAGALENARCGFLSPAEVRAMSPADVRKNYQSILHSMRKWN